MQAQTRDKKDAITYRRPWMYPKQESAFFNDSRYAVCEASTKSGKTTGCVAWLLEQAVRGKSAQNFWWCAPVYGQAKIAYRRVKRGLPEWVYVANESELTITLKNGAVLWFKSAEKPDALYGEDVHACVIDEASRVREESWFAVRSTLTATRGPVRIIGNVKGRKNWAYRMARKAEAGEEGYSYHKITAYDAVEAGVLDASEIEDARRSLPEHVFRELYLAEPSDDGGNPFGLDAIERCVVDEKSPEGARAYGVDLAKSVDYTVMVGLDESGTECAFGRFRKPWGETIRAVREEVGRVGAYVDSTGVGDPVVEDLQRTASNFEGFKFSATSKQMLLEGLSVAIQRGDVKIASREIISELQIFEYAYTRTGVRYAAPEGSHDDCVMALALAVRALSDLRGMPVDESATASDEDFEEHAFGYDPRAAGFAEVEAFEDDRW